MYRIDIMDFFSRKKIRKKIEDVPEYIKLCSDLAREIYINAITPQIAEYIDKTIRMWNEIDDAEGDQWNKRIPIKIYINSIGGDFNSMLMIMDSIKISRTPVYTINTGVALKEAFYIFLAGHQRYAYPKSSFLYERDLKHLEDTEAQSDNYFSYYEKQLLILKDLILDKTKITENEYNKHLKNVWWINAEEAQKLKICNEVIFTYKALHY